MKNSVSMFDRLAVAACIAMLGVIGCFADQYECDDNNPCADPGEVCVFYLDEAKQLVATACAKQYEILAIEGSEFAFGIDLVSVAQFEYFDKKMKEKDKSYAGYSVVGHGAETNRCNWNAIDSNPENPMNCVHKDEAEAFCKWSQARLCTKDEHDQAVLKGVVSDYTFTEWLVDDENGTESGDHSIAFRCCSDVPIVR